MSRLREGLVEQLFEHSNQGPGCDCGWIASAERSYFQQHAEHKADAVLRVLAEHGDTEQVREQVFAAVGEKCRASDGIHYCHDTNAEHRADAIMAVVARIVAARDAAVERADKADAFATKVADDCAELMADLAAARQQLADCEDAYQTALAALERGSTP